MNVCIFVGRLTDDPKMGTDKKGDPFASFTLAVQRKFDRDKADFIRCMIFGKPADIIDEHCRKGLRLSVMGTLQIDDSDEFFGRSTLMVDQFTLVEFADDNGGDRGRSNDRGNDYRRGGGRGGSRGGNDRGGGRGRDDRGGRSDDRGRDGGRGSYGGNGRDDSNGRGDNRGGDNGGSNRGNDPRGDDRRTEAPVGGPAPAEDEYDPFADE